MKAIALSVSMMMTTMACSSAPPSKGTPDFPYESEPPARQTKKKGAPATEDESVLEGAPVDPASSDGNANDASITTMRGTATTTNTFGFGGDPYACNWNITLKSLVLDVSVDATSREVKSATFRAQAVEQTLPPCSAAPYPPNEHQYTLAMANVIAPRVTRLSFDPKSTNLPIAAASIDIDFSTTPATASVRVHRTDQDPPLDWTVVAKLDLESLTK